MMLSVSWVRPPDWVVGQTHPLFREAIGSGVKAIPRVKGGGLAAWLGSLPSLLAGSWCALEKRLWQILAS